jgi:hypothetical protein
MAGPDTTVHLPGHFLSVQTAELVELHTQVLQSLVQLEPGMQVDLQVLVVQTVSPVVLQMQVLQARDQVLPGTQSVVYPSAPGQVEGHRPYLPCPCM